VDQSFSHLGGNVGMAMVELGDGLATIGHRWRRVTMTMQNLVEVAGSCLCTDSVLQ
jgi:hypothetical protein